MSCCVEYITSCSIRLRVVFVSKDFMCLLMYACSMRGELLKYGTSESSIGYSVVKVFIHLLRIFVSENLKEVRVYVE